MYKSLPSFILAFHGCDESVKQKVLNSKERLNHSKNDYDWLGHGIYFWENDPERAIEYAELLAKHPERTKGRITQPAVIGAVIDLGRCLNLVESHSLKIVKEAFVNLKQKMYEYHKELPNNQAVQGKTDLLLRELDCLVFEYIHENNSIHQEFDSVRGVFWEGEELYPSAGFKEKNHIQICVRNPNCIKGYFDPLDPVPEYSIP
ncbi:MAG: hypothetical protein A2Y33_03325 [Spirochaetes bacterium GWF1_51_8]|nr:MAG: hypothetical protein A2Y33_03325 [Spirochaetes bacterium GWF1_51_8]